MYFWKFLGFWDKKMKMKAFWAIWAFLESLFEARRKNEGFSGFL
jgi:hypothetical protein